tara:strand:+ start:44135 stop:45016 length:882 start_codon:yes stop_codon:yes gene_type:complete
MLTIVGCGTTRERQATEQLVMSDAVDRSVSRLDFRPLTGQKVYLDTSYLRSVKGEGFVNSDYVISAMRQQIVAAGCLIQDTLGDSDIVIEPRLGTLGLDDHRVTFGLPENNAISSAVALIPNAPSIPAIPEVALARRDAQEAAAKVAAFAYDRRTREPIWQSGVNYSLATAKDTWVFGVGPFQGGSIREETKLAGSKLKLPFSVAHNLAQQNYERPAVEYTAQVAFNDGWPTTDPTGNPIAVPKPPAPSGMEWPVESIAEKPADASGGDKKESPVRIADSAKPERKPKAAVKR